MNIMNPIIIILKYHSKLFFICLIKNTKEVKNEEPLEKLT
jgi:hypothetical protein